MMGLGVEVKGLRELEKQLGDSSKFLHTNMQIVVRNTAFELERNAKAGAPVFTGTGRRSITTQFDSSGDGLAARVGTNLFYMSVMEYGRRAGARQPPSGPGSALRRWANRKRLPAYIVARNIARNGIKPRRYMGSAYDRAAAAWPDRVQKAVENALEMAEAAKGGL
jgi:hypothetical protein